MAPLRLLLPIALGALGWTAGALAHEPAVADCVGWSCGPWSVLPVVIALLASIGAGVLLHVVWLRLSPPESERTRVRIEDREWPVFVTRRDGRVIVANAGMREALARRDAAAEILGPLLGITPAEVYRLSRVAVQDGLAVERFSAPARHIGGGGGDRDGDGDGDGDGRSGDGAAVMLAVTLAGRDRLVWQLMPAARLGALRPGGPARDHDTLPFGYLRISSGDGVLANDIFRRVFAEEAIEILREQVDAGILVAGRTLLPGVDGRDRLALTAIVTERGGAKSGSTERRGAGDTHEIYLFVPDADTASQVSAAETLEAIPVSLVQLDLEGRVLWGNAQAREMLGHRFDTGMMLDELVQPLGRSLDSMLNGVRSGREDGGGEMVRLEHASYDVFAQVSLTRMVLQGQPCLIAVLNDASELRLLEDKFAQSQKMEAVGKLAGGVAHDFNNVLTAISGHCDLLLLRKDANHPDFSDLTQIRQNANRAATLVRQLLAFSRKQTLQPRLLSVQDVVTDTLYLLDRLIGETISLNLQHGRDLGSVRADNQQLEQALMNLVVNARDAMPDGGAVTIATRNVSIAVEEKRPGISVPAGDYVEIAVSDQGHGIEPHLIARVFDPFFTTKPKGEGTGLGLSTVYGIVKQSGGYIYVENRMEGGARFTILLPRAWPRDEEAAPGQADAPAPPPPDLTGQGAVMLVEDEAPVRSFASRALKLRGYRVVEAESAEDAMVLLSEGHEDVDVLVSDVVMPGMDGPTFAEKARRLRPELRVIFISGYAEDSFRRNLIDSDFMFLPKPFSLNDLTAKVKLAMDSRPKSGATPAQRHSAPA